MSRPDRVALIGNSLPRRCGIATFTSDLERAISQSLTKPKSTIVAMTDNGHSYAYPPSVGFQVRDDKLDDYIGAARFLNAGQFDVVTLQHEFGIFGGDAGEFVLTLLARLNMPVVTTLHTVLSEPTKVQRDVMNCLIGASSKLVVMADKGRELLHTVYRAPENKIEVIAHGIPEFPFVEPDGAKSKLGFAGRPVILTFGLLSPNKGIEVMIDAMPAILEGNPDALYVVLGATHPNLVRTQGEAYRNSLVARVRNLGVEDHVQFLNQFVDQPTLLDFISMCDVYVTPYLNAAQMTSGTLAYSFGLGKAVVSTPYWHARELLGDGRGVLVPFNDVPAIGVAIAGLLSDPAHRSALRERAYASSRSMTWSRTAERYMAVFVETMAASRRRAIAAVDHGACMVAPPEMRTGYFHAMCDDTGLFQHAVYSTPDRHHGYCVDDNARALLLACALNKTGEEPLSENHSSRFAAFIQHAWNPDNGRFRNFMSFDRRWLEDTGSEDSHGRTLWALGECAQSDVSAQRRRWASGLFQDALKMVETFQSPRAWAFTLLGLDAYCRASADDLEPNRIRRLLANKLMTILASVETKEWTWFEEGLSYENARLSQALLLTGHALRLPDHVNAGLRSLRWLMAVQTTSSRNFRPVGSASFHNIRELPKPFDQQPLEATAAISACLAGWRISGDASLRTDASRAFAWFFGANDLSLSLVDLATGSCCDGLHPDRLNENRGGESVVSYLLSLAEVRELARASEEKVEIAAKSATRLIAPVHPFPNRGRIV